MAGTTIPQVVNNFNVYNDDTPGSRLVAVASEVKLPTLQYKSTTLDAAGTAGEVAVPIPGQIQSDQIEINFNITDEQYFQLAAGDRCALTLRAAVQTIDSKTAEIKFIPLVINVRGMVSQMTLGSVKKADGQSGSMTIEILYFAMTYNNSDTKTVELDKLNNILTINGKDKSNDITKLI
jgi:P2 family phage contractile tail tube protein